MSNESPLSQAAALEASRPKYTFKIPEVARSLTSDPSSVTMKMLTVAEERQASQTAIALKTNGVYELVKASVVEADGKPVTWENAGKDVFWESCSPKVRQLMMAAFDKVNLPSGKETEDFLSSMTAKVG